MSEFTIRELECFQMVADELSFTRAADRLRLAQPPLSRHIRNLEEKLGLELFDRTKRQVSLTRAGEAFRVEAGQILVSVSRAADSARRASRGETGQLRIGFVSAVLSPELVGVFSGFRSRHPEVQLTLADQLPSDQLINLERNELDIGFVGIVPEKLPAGVLATPWREEPLLAFLPPGHRFAERKQISLRSLEGEPFVMISPEAAPAFSRFFHERCAESGFRPRIVQEASRAQAVAAMTAAGTGVSVLPASLNRITDNAIPLLLDRRRLSITHVVAHRNVSGASMSAFLEELG